MPLSFLRPGAVPGLVALLALGSASTADADATRPAASVAVTGTEFRITRADGTELRGTALVGTVLTVAGLAGRPVRIRIDSVERDAKDPEIVLHEFSVWNAATGGWKSLCEPNPEGVRKGFPMRGTLDARVEYQPDAPGFSLACIAGAQAKCVRWGYKPWKDGVAGVRMLDLYRACMRMTRADYCGNGTGTTRNGTPIDLYDKVGIQAAEASTTMRFEAAWGPQGALCVRHTRVPENMTLDGLAARCPRLSRALGESCDEHVPGALLYNKSHWQLPAAVTSGSGASAAPPAPPARGAVRSPHPDPVSRPAP